MIDSERRAALDAIAREVAVCKRCRLHEARTRAVPGEGNAATEVMFVGEGPGFNEDRQGRPFVGQAGALLTELLGSIGWARDEVFITNVVKCRPPGNRDPEPDEIAACAGYLSRQIEALDPALVVTLGRFSMARFNPGARIGQVHGTFRQADAGSGAPAALTFAMYHPAAALHQGSLKDTLFRDMTGIPAALIEARRRRAENANGPAPEIQAPEHEVAPEVEPAVQSPAIEPAGAAQPSEQVELAAERVASVLAETVTEPVEGGAETGAIEPGTESAGPASSVESENAGWVDEVGQIEPASEMIVGSGESDPTDQLTLF